MTTQSWRRHTSIISPERQRRASSARRWRSGLVGLLLFLPAAAQAQSELNHPYNLHIVVHVAENRLLTGVFRDGIERELRDGFQAALDDMGRVEVDHKHPRLKDVLARGLRTSLDEWKERGDWKTHFVLIDYSGVHYEIQTRQYDGTIGRASPVVRRDRTRDREFVAKAAALLIKQDFGVLGTVREELQGAMKRVKVELRGGGLGDMTRWVKKDDIFALAAPDGGSPAALRWSLLQVEQAPTEDPRNGECVCRFFHRYRVRSIAGYRCIKLGTVRAPLRLRWMQQLKDNRLKPPNQKLSVEIRRYGFEGEKETILEKTSDFNGFLDTSHDKDGVFDNVAFVSVVFGRDDKPQVPIPLVDDQPITVEVNASNDFDTLFTIHKANWQSNIADSLQMQAALFKRLAELGVKPEENRGEIIQIAKSGLNRAKSSYDELRKEQEDLVREAKRLKKDLKTSFEEGRIQQLVGYKTALEQFITEQAKIEKEESDPHRKKWRTEIARAKLLEKDLELGQVIEIYERIRKDGYKDAQLDEYLKLLHAKWDLHGDQHKEARGFIYRVWPTLDSERLEENIDQAKNAFKTCQKVHDRVSILKLHSGTMGHAERLKKELDELQPELVSTDEKESLQKKAISEKIVKLGLEIQEQLQKTADDK